LNQVTWVTGDPPDRPAVTVQYRAHGEANPAVFAVESDQVLVHFDRTQYGIAIGQTAALYDGDEVVGSGIIVA
jgi:tRNA-specific 2-thiouridylase